MQISLDSKVIYTLPAMKLKFDLNNHCVNTQSSGTITLSILEKKMDKQNVQSEHVTNRNYLRWVDLNYISCAVSSW